MNLKNINRILIIRFSSLGDLILTTPFVRSLKNKYPHLEIDFLCRKEYEDVLLHNPNLNSLLCLTRADSINEIRERIRKNKYDLIIDLQNNLRSRLISSFLSKFKRKIKKPSIKKILLVKSKINLLKERISIPDRYGLALNKFELDKKGAEVFLPSGSKTTLSKDKNYVGLCPGSKHFTKKWPTDYYIECGKKFRKLGYEIVIFGGKDDKEDCVKVSEGIGDCLNLCNENDLFQTAIDMKSCSMIVCNDSGLMHLAAAMNVPLIALFGSTVREFGFSPYRSPNLILENNSLSCRPCSHIGRNECPLEHFKCLRDISPDNLIAKFQQFQRTL